MASDDAMFTLQEINIYLFRGKYVFTDKLELADHMPLASFWMVSH